MKALFAAQDPGGANAILPVAAALMAHGDTVVARVEGAAQHMFAARGFPLGAIKPDVVVLGTSGGESVEKRVTDEFRHAVPIVAVLDFWSNYWQRFSTLGAKDFAYLPDRICVMDEVARDEMLAEGFPPERIAVTGNPHFDHFADGITRDREDPKRVLFVSQPIRADARLPGFAPAAADEFSLLADVTAALPPGHTLSVRLHPRDERSKYDAYLDGRVTLAPEKTLEEALSASGLIIGPATPVLMQAAAAGKKALCYEPGLSAPDTLVSNRVGVTTRVSLPEELRSALAAYVRRDWPYATRPLRDVWPLGATERVVAVVRSLAERK
ncbi:TPA: hypothetical protein DIV48_01250 [Candidatus Kaiserbacteria bacterium]|nr:MAG: hypothetical protein UY93_C0002G0042 [Parcubacteria group bacterium GW2011_GWA1_56_13]KKW45505.1 MAG: hypothetical protein UY97_C0020G0002 [Parcubacteria group bacterium GW2011_GWB1_57_6]HCR52258.1 hypothetical protein [Candidatus Kaiserbacteria bacterium]